MFYKETVNHSCNRFPLNPGLIFYQSLNAHTVDSKINRALQIVSVKKLIPNAVL